MLSRRPFFAEYLTPEQVGKENSWAFFFEQPLRIGLNEALNSDNILLTKGFFPLRLNTGMAFFTEGTKELIEWRMLVKLGLLKIKPALYEEALALRKTLFAPNALVLGVQTKTASKASKVFSAICAWSI